MPDSNKLKKYVCTYPFTYLDVQPTSQWVCCPSWAPTNLRASYKPINFTENLLTNWKSPIAQDIRRSMIDGSYDHCNHKICPSINQLTGSDKIPHNFITKEEFQNRYEIRSVDDLDKFQNKPKEILFGFDRSCNLRCPSCRPGLVPNDDTDSEQYKIKLFILNQIETHFAESATKLSITGSGDPFYSKIYRDYLINFDSSKYPNLEEIQIITNGILLNQKMFESLKARPYIKTIEISVDAGTQHTYENVTRLGGDWKRLLKNIQYLSTQASIKKMIFSMVVSQHNYTEMLPFYKIIANIFKNSKIQFRINFRQHVFWKAGALSIQEVKNISIFDRSHPDLLKFIDQLMLVKDLPNVGHNFHYLFNGKHTISRDTLGDASSIEVQ